MKTAMKVEVMDTSGSPEQVVKSRYLEALHLVRPGTLVVLQHLDHVATVLLLADKQQALQVLRFAARLDDVAVRATAHV